MATEPENEEEMMHQLPTEVTEQQDLAPEMTQLMLLETTDQPDDETNMAACLGHFAEAKRRWNKLPPEVRQQHIQRAETVTSYQKREKAGGVFTSRERQRVLDLLSAKSPQTLYNWLERIRLFRLIAPDDKLAPAYALVKRSGRPKKRLLTDDQEMFVLGAYVFADWEIIFPDNSSIPSRERVQVEFIYKLLKRSFGNLPDDLTLEYLKKFIREKRKQDETLFVLGREEMARVWREYVPKLPSNVRKPNEQWISDARKLPIFIIHKGKKCTVTLITIIDQATGYILAWGLIPTIAQGDDGEFKRVDFTESDVRLLLVTAICEAMLCPESWYTDRGSQYVAIQPFLPFLSVDEEHEIIGILGFPGHPWSRGKVEVTLREFNKAIKKFAGSGFIRDEEDKNEIKRACKEAKLKLEKLETAIETHVGSWNHGAQEGHKSRYEQWQDASRVGHLTPPLESLIPNSDDCL